MFVILLLVNYSPFLLTMSSVVFISNFQQLNLEILIRDLPSVSDYAILLKYYLGHRKATEKIFPLPFIWSFILFVLQLNWTSDPF